MERRIGYKYCTVCAREYKICPKCEELAGKKILSWKYTCDTPECFQIHMVLHGYFCKEYTKEQAKELLISLGADKLQAYDENAKKLIDEIMYEEPKPKAEAPKTSNNTNTQKYLNKFVK
jgi:hypothetical protein